MALPFAGSGASPPSFSQQGRWPADRADQSSDNVMNTSLLSAPDSEGRPFWADDADGGTRRENASGLASQHGSIRRTDAVAMLKRAASQREMKAQQQQQQQQDTANEAERRDNLAHEQTDGRGYGNQEGQVLQDNATLGSMPNTATGSAADPQALAALKLQMQVQQYLQTQQQIQQLQASLLAQGMPQHLVNPSAALPFAPQNQQQVGQHTEMNDLHHGAQGTIPEAGDDADDDDIRDEADEEEDEEDTEHYEDEREDDFEEGRTTIAGAYPINDLNSAASQFASFPLSTGFDPSAHGTSLNSAFSPGFMSPLPPVTSTGAVSRAAAQSSLPAMFSPGSELLSDSLLHTPAPFNAASSLAGFAALQQQGTSPSDVHSHQQQSNGYDMLGPPLSALSERQRSPLPSLEQLRARILHERQKQSLRRSASTSAAASAAARAYALEKLMGVGAGYSQKRALSPTDELEMGRNRERRKTMLGMTSDDSEEEAGDDALSHRSSRRRFTRPDSEPHEPLPPLPVAVLSDDKLRDTHEEEEDLEDEDERGDEIRREKRASRIPLAKIQTKLPPLPSSSSASALRSTFSSDSTTSPTTPTSISLRISSSTAGGVLSSPQSSTRMRPLLRRSKTIGGLTAMAEQSRKLAFVNDLMKPLPKEPKEEDKGEGTSASASGNLTPNANLSRAGSQREVARAELLRKLSGRRPNAAPALQQLSSSSTMSTPQAGSHQEGATRGELAVMSMQREAGFSSSRSDPRPANLTISAANTFGTAANSLLTPPAPAQRALHRSGSFESIGSSSGVPTTAGLSPGFVAARNRASAIARATGEDNFMFESASSDGDDEDQGFASDVSLPVHIEDVRRRSGARRVKPSSSAHMGKDYSESTEEDGDYEGGLDHEDFVQIHEELQEEEDEQDALEAAEAAEAKRMEATKTVPSDATFDDAEESIRSRIFSADAESIAGARILHADTARPQRVHELTNDSQSDVERGTPSFPPDSVSVPLALNISTSPVGKLSRRDDWPQSMSSFAGRSSLGDDLAGYRDLEPDGETAFPGVEQLLGTDISEARQILREMNEGGHTPREDAVLPIVQAKNEAAEAYQTAQTEGAPDLDDHYLESVDRLADTLGRFADHSMSRTMSNSTSSSGLPPPRPISKDSFVGSSRSMLREAEPMSKPTVVRRKDVPTMPEESNLSGNESPSALSPQGTSVHAPEMAAERSPSPYGSKKLDAFPGLSGASNDLVQRTLMPMQRMPTPPNVIDDTEHSHSSLSALSAAPEKIKKSLFGSLRRKASPTNEVPNDDQTMAPEATPETSPRTQQQHFSSVGTSQETLLRNRIVSTESNVSESSSSPAPLDGGFPDTIRTRLEHSDALAPDTFVMLHRYSQMLTQQATGIPGVSSAAMDSPPRSLLRAVPVFQVVTASGIKDRFLFVFNDILAIAKPVAASPSPGSPSSPMNGLGMADLSWTFSVKAILELRFLKLTIPRDHAEQAKPHPLMKSLVARFAMDPEGAIADVITRSGLPKTSSTTAQLLLQTPDLDKDALTAYLCNPRHRAVMQAYLSNQRFTGVSIESALRAMMLGLRFPSDPAAYRELLEAFARRWTETNVSLIKVEFTEELAVRLVYAMVSLNDALHRGNEHAPAPGYFSDVDEGLSREEFVQTFRQHDPSNVLSDQTLLRIYASIRSEPLAQALSSEEGRPLPVMLSAPVSSKLTYGQTSQPVTVTIPEPDRDFAIRLYGQDITFDPPILTFGSSNSRSFTMTSRALGSRHIIFVRAGRNSRYYQGTYADGIEPRIPLPRSATVSVERAFMQHTFTISSTTSSRNNVKRYMFSVEDSAKRGFVTDVLSHKVEEAKRVASSSSMTPARKATEAIALQALRDALVDVDPADGGNSGLQRSASAGAAHISPPREPMGNLGRATSSSAVAPPSRGLGGGLRVVTLKNAFGGFGKTSPSKLDDALDRQTSTSKHYYAPDGAGRMERDLLHRAGGGGAMTNGPGGVVGSIKEDEEMAPTGSGAGTAAPSATKVSKVKTGDEIVTICQQNSLLPLVLAHLKKE